MSISLSALRVQRVRHELKRRDLRVVRVETISPHFRSVTFGGDSLADFVSASFDDHVKFMLDADGSEPVRRDYTPRRFDAEARELTVEFALHGDGPAALWAAQAAPGQRATIGGPRGSLVIAPDHDWHLLVGDETALPAIARRLEELPPETRAIVILQVRDPADRRVLRSAAALDVQWVADAGGTDRCRARAGPACGRRLRVVRRRSRHDGDAAPDPGRRQRPRPPRDPRRSLLEAGRGGAPREPRAMSLRAAAC